VDKRDEELLEIIKNRLVEAYHPELIYLFGSHAWGEPTADSDFDFAVVLKSSDLPMTERMRIGLRVLGDIPIGVDLLVFTETEMKERLQYRSTLHYKIVRDGVKIYEAA
jgi:predicted nucleotidyltransferase